MLNPLVTVISGGRVVTSPFAGGKKTRGITKKHYPLVWGCMLGTVYARDWTARPATGKEYFDYDYAAAHKHARVAECTDLRIVKTTVSMGAYGPRVGSFALWGVLPK